VTPQKCKLQGPSNNKTKMKSLSKTTMLYIVGGIAAAGGNVILAPVYLRILSQEEYGEWSQFNVILQFIQPIMGLGLNAAMARYISDSTESQQSRLIASAIKINTAFNILLIVIIGLFLVILRLLELKFLDNVTTKKILCLCIISISLTYSNILFGVYVAKGEALYHRGLSFLGFSFQVIAITLVWQTALANLNYVYTASLIASVGYGGFAACQLLRLACWEKSDNYKKLILFGIPIVLYSFVSQVSGFASRVYLSNNVAESEVGAFNALCLYASTVAMLVSSINLAWVPRYYRNAEIWSKSGVYSNYTDSFTGMTSTFALILVVLQDEFLSLYSGGTIKPDPRVLTTLVLSSWIGSAIWVSYSNILFQLQRTRDLVFANIVSNVLAILVGMFTIRKFGVIGASAVLLTNCLVVTGMVAFYAQHHSKIKINIWKNCVQIGFIIFFAYLTSLVSRANTNYTVILALKSAMIVFYFGLVYKMSLKKSRMTYLIVNKG